MLQLSPHRRILRRSTPAGVWPLLSALTLLSNPAWSQQYGKPDRGRPADEMIQTYLSKRASELHARFLEGIETRSDWEGRRPRLKEEYWRMLGLWPLPEKTPLRARVTGRINGDGYVVEMLHYQSRPRLYVTANLYRPENVPDGERLPAVLYVCGHSGRGRNGNKTAFQSHGIWFARHGYVCLVLDTLQLGEIAALHHGTYREQRWWWHSRGYTPAGVECWNGVRGIDYLQGRADVDPNRIAVTGISGGGAATFWIAAADERVKVAVPVSGMADLPSYVSNRVINGHCDCMFFYNTYGWPWARIAALIAPRPFLFANSDQDPIFPMDANDRISNRMERFYSLVGASDVFDAAVSIGGHAYRRDLRRAIFRFINTHLKNDPRPVNDSEVDLVAGGEHPIPPRQLRVFPDDADIPADEINTRIDEHFVPHRLVAPRSAASAAGESFGARKRSILAELRAHTSLRWLPPAGELSAPEVARPVAGDPLGIVQLTTEEGIQTHLRRVSGAPKGAPEAVVVYVTLEDFAEPEIELPAAAAGEELAVYVFEPRGGKYHPWTRRNPPNYVERSHVLLGTTVDTGRIHDIRVAARYARQAHGGGRPVRVVGTGAAGVLAAYAAVFDSAIDEVVLAAPPLSHEKSHAPQVLSILRICDVPDMLGFLAPRSLTLRGLRRDQQTAAERVRAAYVEAEAESSLRMFFREQGEE